MITILKFEGNDKTPVHTSNCSDGEVILKELCSRCQKLETEILKINKVKKNWLIVNEKNEKISNSLLKIKIDCESYKSNLYKTLCELKVSTDKQKILFKKKSDEYFEKRKAFEVYYEASPFKYKLKELTNINRSLEEEWKNKIGLYELTKRQYYELLNFLIKTFIKKVCEFCEEVLKAENRQ